MNPVHCVGTLKRGRLAGKPCRKFLGLLTVPYDKVICPRCGEINSLGAPTELAEQGKSP